MYKLIKITSSGCNVPERTRIPFSESASCERATPFYIENGVLVAVNASSTRLPTHVTVSPVSGTEALAYEISPQMVFAVKADGDPLSMHIGTEYLLTADGKSVTSTKVSGSLRGAVLLSKNGAKKTGDEIFVSFR